jgi:hypothetical protein
VCDAAIAHTQRDIGVRNGQISPPPLLLCKGECNTVARRSWVLSLSLATILFAPASPWARGRGPFGTVKVTLFPDVPG